MLPPTIARWLVTAAAVWTASLALRWIVRAAAATAAAVLLLGVLTNPADPLALGRAVWQAARGPVVHLLGILAWLGRMLWQFILSAATG